jgi:hypothetical protein
MQAWYGLCIKKNTEPRRRQLSAGVHLMIRPCNEKILKTLELVERMIEISDEGDIVREDAGCGVLYGVLRDSAYKIKKLAEDEKETHMRKGWWPRS